MMSRIRRRFGKVRKLPSGRYQASFIAHPVSGRMHHSPSVPGPTLTDGSPQSKPICLVHLAR